MKMVSIMELLEWDMTIIPNKVMTYVILIWLLRSTADLWWRESPLLGRGAKFINVVFYLIIVEYKLAIKKLETVDVKCLKILRKR